MILKQICFSKSRISNWPKYNITNSSHKMLLNEKKEDWLLKFVVIYYGT